MRLYLLACLFLLPCTVAKANTNTHLCTKAILSSVTEENDLSLSLQDRFNAINQDDIPVCLSQTSRSYAIKDLAQDFITHKWKAHEERSAQYQTEREALILLQKSQLPLTQ